MKVLIVSGYFYPEITPRSFRTTELAKELSKQGHDVIVCIPFKGYCYKKLSKELNIKFIDLGNIKGIRKKHISIKLVDKIVYLWQFILQYFIEYPYISLVFKVNKTIKLFSGFDLLISIAHPYSVHWGVALARKKNNRIAKTWIADCGDPFMGVKTGRFKKLSYFSYIEKWFCSKTDFITIPFQGAIASYYPQFHYKIKIIPQGFNFENLPNREIAPINPILTFAYSGIFYKNTRDPTNFLNYLCSLKTNFKFIIFTNNNILLEPYLIPLKNKIEIRPFIPREELLPILSKMDFLINFDNDSSVQIPSKLIDYALSNRPILNIKKDLDISLINDFFNKNYERQIKIENIENYNIKNVVKEFLKLTH